MSLKSKVDAMRIVTRVRSSKHGYNSDRVYPVLYAYIDELEAKLAKPAQKAAPNKTPAKKATPKKAPAKKSSAKSAKK